MLTIESVIVTEPPPHYPEIRDTLWHAAFAFAFERFLSCPERLAPDRFATHEDQYGRTWEFRFTVVPNPAGDSIEFEGYANPPGQREQPTHRALITASFTNPQEQDSFVAALRQHDVPQQQDHHQQSDVPQPEPEPEYRPYSATEALRVMGTYDRLGEDAMLLHVCAAREKPSALPPFSSSNVEVLDDSSTVAVDLTQHPHRYRFTWHLQDQAKSATRPVQQPLRDSFPAFAPVALINWPSSDDVVAMIIEHAVSLLAPDSAPILDADPSLMAAADFLAPSLRPLVIEYINRSAQPQEAIDVLQPLIAQYADLLWEQVPGDELNRISRYVMDHHPYYES